jgi:hypothetical protein
MLSVHKQIINFIIIWTTDTQAIKAVPLKLNTTTIKIGHNTESLAVKCSNFNISAS